MPLGGLTLFRFRGIDLKLHVSLIFLLFYVVIVSSVQVPRVALDAGIPAGALSGPPLLWGFIFALSLLISVAAHEFGHALMAQRMRIAVRSITLMMLGGVSEIGEFPRARFAEFKLAVVGPLVSLAIGALALLSRRWVGSYEASFFLYWTGAANLTLGVFNLFPAFPLDGGRILRSLLFLKKDYAESTRIAVKIGRGAAWFFGIVGVLQFNLLLLAIAVFIAAAGEAEYGRVLSEQALEGALVDEAMLFAPILDPDDDVQVAAAQFLRSRLDRLPVAGAAGVGALLALERVQAVDRALWNQVRVRELAVPQQEVAILGRRISDSLGALTASPLQALPVYDQGEVVGVLRNTDVGEFMRFRKLGQAMRETQKKAA